MRKICSILPIILCFAFCISGCTKVVQSDADVLRSKVWYAENISGISASLEFFGDKACFVVFDGGKQVASISGFAAVDKENFYITDDAYASTFEFGYKVFENRAEVTYGSETLVFYSAETSSNDEVSELISVP